MSNMNRLDRETRARVISALVEGNSLRATSRMTGVARMTVEKLLRDLGETCSVFHDKTVRNVKTRRVQADELWAFCYAKRRNVTPEILERNPDAGDVWTWTAIDADTKLMVSWTVGSRDSHTGVAFIRDVASRLSNRVQLSTDGNGVYFTAVEEAFGEDIDWAIINKIYADGGHNQGGYSPAKLSRTTRASMKGRPDAGHVSTSYVERQNLTMRMHMRRFTRLTNGFSKKVEMHAAAVALHFVYYNFCKVHMSLRVTPAMESGITDHAWEIPELIALLP